MRHWMEELFKVKTKMSMQELADDYVALSLRIKHDAGVLTELRKKLKKADALLLAEMKRQGAEEVSSDGILITRASKLFAK